MKVSIILFLFFGLIISCQNKIQDEDDQLEHETEEIIHKIEEGDLEILNIDGCEYIVFKDGREVIDMP